MRDVTVTFILPLGRALSIQLIHDITCNNMTEMGLCTGIGWGLLNEYVGKILRSGDATHDKQSLQQDSEAGLVT